MNERRNSPKVAQVLYASPRTDNSAVLEPIFSYLVGAVLRHSAKCTAAATDDEEPVFGLLIR
jgi:hypothetical protein